MVWSFSITRKKARLQRRWDKLWNFEGRAKEPWNRSEGRGWGHNSWYSMNVYCNQNKNYEMEKWSSYLTGQFKHFFLETTGKFRWFQWDGNPWPPASAMVVQCFTNWAMKPHRWEQVIWIYMKEYMTLDRRVLHVSTYAQQIDLLPTVGAHLVGHCTGIAAEVVGSNPAGGPLIFQVFLRDICLNCPVKCEYQFSFSSIIRT